MPAGATAMTLTTDRLILRPQREQDAAVLHQLRGERDERVPPHRRPDAHGPPTVADIADDLRQQQDAVRPGLLTVVLQGSGEAIGYCGVVWDADGVRPELAFELLGAMHNREARLHRDRGGHEGRPARTLSDDPVSYTHLDVYKRQG